MLVYFLLTPREFEVSVGSKSNPEGLQPESLHRMGTG